MIAACTGGLLSTCSDAALERVPLEPLPTVPDTLGITGVVCTRPAAEVTFPVKLLFVLDQSASLQCTDPELLRFAAVEQVVADLRPQPHIRFGFVGFSSWTRRQGFTRDIDDIRAFLDPSAGLGPATDYQGAMATVTQLLEEDMRETDPVERSRTRYVVVVVSDGSPEPRCLAGCEDDRGRCADGEDNDGDGRIDGDDDSCANIDDNTLHPDNLYGVCNTDREIPEDLYVDMDGRCPEYNQPRQIVARINEMRRLRDVWSAGDVTLHTVLLFAPEERVEAICPGASSSFGYNGEVARQALRSMAAAGGGAFRDVNLDLEDDSFLAFDFASLESRQWLTELYPQNMHARRYAGALHPDSDADGLADDEERALGTAVFDDDSDDDGRLLLPEGDRFGDLLEARRAHEGLDPTRAELPAVRCSELQDFDGDGLRDCEEALLGTDRRDPDTDGDLIDDRLELVAGTDPTVADAHGDLDFDGIPNRAELRAGSDPRRADLEVWSTERSEVRLRHRGDAAVLDEETGETELRRCLDFEVEGVRLVTPPLGTERGLNRVLIHSFEKPLLLVGGARARSSVACLEVFYRGTTDREPADEVIDLGAEAWAAARRELTEGVAAVAACAGGSVDLDQLRGLGERCLPDKVRVGDRLLPRGDLLDVLERLLDADAAPELPEEPWQIFVPTALFRPARDCWRPSDLARGLGALSALAEACAACPAESP